MNTKEFLRQSSLNRLKKLTKSQNRYYSKKINRYLISLINSFVPKKKSTLFYIPMSHEADVNPSIKYFRKKCKVCVPFMEDVSFKMVAYRLPLRVGKFKIKQPMVTKTNIKNIEIIVVPVIAVDKVFKRVGFGKGMYDRFYEKLHKKPIVIFVQPFLCHTNRVVTQKHDIVGDFLVTYRGILRKEARDGDRNYRRKRNKRSSGVVSYKEIPRGQAQFLSQRRKG